MRAALLTLTASLALLGGCASESEPQQAKPMGEAPAQAPASDTAQGASIDRASLALFGRLPKVMTSDGQPPDAAKVALGRQLYYDGRLSKSQDISCNSCHPLDKFGADGQPTSPGHKGQRGDRNSPTTYHAAGHLAQFWDGRAATVEAQAMGPVTNPVEMAMANNDVAAQTLRTIPGYVEQFNAVYGAGPDAVSLEHAADAIGAFERGLITPSRWDTFLAGDDSALTPAEKQGLKTFMDTGCQTCHLGPMMGGAMFQKLGLAQAWPADEADPGRAKVTGAETDRLFFKVPSLRNVTQTGPYFHNGKVADLHEAVRLMGWHQLGKELSKEQIDSIVTFLGALEGALPAEYIAPPELPASGPNTPKPDPS